ncbi:MAG TPA: bifunctional YncE family protein/alkaline phosphatase family protein [Bryobacteraceae bacterium]|nr:bifunctional YncE family protein/alkaline phosphatase family protein [Bryobacteraceae bacterium]
MLRACFVAGAALGCAFAAHYRTPAGTRPVSTRPGELVIPGGRLLTPAGDVFRTGSGTFGVAVSADGKQVITVDGGPDGFSVTSIESGSARKNWSRPKRAKVEDDWRSVFLGVAFGPNGTIWASEGNSGRVRAVGTGVVDLNTAGFSDSYSGDLAIDPSRAVLYVADQANFRVVAVDMKRRRVLGSVRVGRLPFAVALSPDKTRLYVTHVGVFAYEALSGGPVPFPVFGFPSRESEAQLGRPDVPQSNSLAVVDVRDAAAMQLVKLIPTGEPFSRKVHGGSSPSGVVATADRVYVTNAHNDSITVVDAKTLQRVRDIPLRIPGLEQLRGVMPVGATLDPTSGLLLVAEAGINAVGVVDLASSRLLGHIPAAWFPARVAVHGNDLWVACAKGTGTGPNKGLPQTFAPDLRRGAVVRVTLADALKRLSEHTQTVMANNGFQPVAKADNPLPQELRNVVVVVKENRTYDEVFGTGARYGKGVTPNHYEIARRYAISDNFYADSEVSVDGHHWLVGSYPNPWTETTLMAAYGGEKDFRLPTTAPGRLSFPGSNSSVHPEEIPAAGTLWHHLERHGISFRNFGEGFELAGADEGPELEPTGVRLKTNMPMPDPLFRNTSRTYPQYNMNIPDQVRADALIRELSAFRELPRLIYIHLPNDHVAEPRPADGYPSAASYVADNDYALGRIVAWLSRRPEWKKTAVLITEDDAQGGVDPVDSHRTLMLVASPWARRGAVSHVHSSFPGLLKTAFRILRIPALNLFDATASDLADCFQTADPDNAPFDIQPANAAVFVPEKARAARIAVSPRMDDPAVLRQQHRQQ